MYTSVGYDYERVWLYIGSLKLLESVNPERIETAYMRYSNFNQIRKARYRYISALNIAQNMFIQMELPSSTSHTYIRSTTPYVYWLTLRCRFFACLCSAAVPFLCTDDQTNHYQDGRIEKSTSVDQKFLCRSA